MWRVSCWKSAAMCILWCADPFLVQFSPPARHDGCCGSVRDAAKPVWLAAAFHLSSAVCLPFSCFVLHISVSRCTHNDPTLQWFSRRYLSSCFWCCLQGHSGSPISQCWTLTTDSSKAVQSEPEDNLKLDTCQILQGKVCQNWEYYILNVTGQTLLIMIRWLQN